MFDLDTVIVSSDNQVSSVLDDEEVILNLENGMYYGLNPVGARVWHLIQEPRTVAEICDALLDEFDAERQRVHQDVVALLNDLHEEQLIKVDESASSAGGSN